MARALQSTAQSDSAVCSLIRNLAFVCWLSLRIRVELIRNAVATGTKLTIVAAYQHRMIGPGVASALIRFLGVQHA